MKLSNLSLFTATILSLGYCPGLFAAETQYLKTGISEYYKGHHAIAKAHLEEAIKKEPKNQKAHYFLAQVLAEKHEYNAAIAEYKKCHAIDPGSECGIKAKEGLEAHHAFQQKHAEQTYKAIRKDRIDTSTDHIATQIEKELASTDDTNKKMAEKKLKDAEKEVERIQKQAQDDMNSLPRLRRNGYWRSQMRQQIQEQAKQRTQDILSRAKTQAEQLDKDARGRQDSLQNMMEGMHGHLNTPTKQGTRLRPEGTSIYVRNYEHK